MKRIALALTLAFTLALGSVAGGFTPTPEQCTAAGGYFNAATGGCDSAPTQAGRTILAVPGVTYDVVAGDDVYYGGTHIYVTSPGTVTFCPCVGW